MALTRPNSSQVNSRITAVSDPITVLNQGSTVANVDVGFLFNRANGLVSNVALYWSEGNQSFITAFTNNTGATNSNVLVSSYAPITVGNIITTNGVFWANGTAYSSGTTGSSGSSSVTYTSVYLGRKIASTATTLIDTIPVVGNARVSWDTISNDSVNNQFRVSTIDSINNGTTVSYNEYGVVLSNVGTTVATFTSNITSGNINLWAIGNSASISVTFERTVLGSATAMGYVTGGINYGSGGPEVDTLSTVTARGDIATANLILPTGENNALGFGGGSTIYSIAMGTTAATYQYGTVSDSSIKMCVSGGASRGFTWGQNGVKPIASLNSTSGNMQIAGTFSAATKSFLIPHPTKPGMQLRYGSLESPYHGVRLTGDAILINGICVVKLPDYIHGLCRQDGSQVQITNIKHGKVIWIEDINIDDDEFTVKCDISPADTTEYKFYWSFTAIRKDIADMEVEIK